MRQLIIKTRMALFAFALGMTVFATDKDKNTNADLPSMANAGISLEKSSDKASNALKVKVSNATEGLTYTIYYSNNETHLGSGGSFDKSAVAWYAITAAGEEGGSTTAEGTIAASGDVSNRGKITGIPYDLIESTSGAGYDISGLNSNDQYWVKVTASAGGDFESEGSIVATGWTYPAALTDETTNSGVFAFSATERTVKANDFEKATTNGNAVTKYRIFYTTSQSLVYNSGSSQDKTDLGYPDDSSSLGSKYSTNQSEANSKLVEIYTGSQGDGQDIASELNLVAGATTNNIITATAVYFVVYPVGAESPNPKLGDALILSGTTSGAGYTFAVAVPTIPSNELTKPSTTG